MAFDGALQSPVTGPLPLVPIAEQGMPVPAGGDISLLDRAALMVGYVALGLAAGAAAAMVMGGLPTLAVAGLAVVPALAALAMARICLRHMTVWTAPLVVLAVIVALGAVTGAFLFGNTSWLGEAVAIAGGLLAFVSLVFCRRFAAAFSVSILGLFLAAPIGAAAMRSMFG